MDRIGRDKEFQSHRRHRVARPNLNPILLILFILSSV